MSSTAPTPVISVVVPAHNAEATLGTTMAALISQRLDQPFEILVVDSASTDGTLAVAQHWARIDSRVKVGVNAGGEPAGSRNLAVAEAAAPLIAFTDADCAPEPGWLGSGIAALADADLVQGMVIPAGPRRFSDRTLAVGHESGLYETANLFIRRQLFDLAGPFEPLPGFAENRPFGEDTWFAWRARRAGAVTAFCADALVRHAVFPRGAGGYIAEARRRRYFPTLVRAVPELRAEFLHHRWFLSAQTARFDLALAGAAAAAGHAVAGIGPRPTRKPVARVIALAAVAPYVLGLPRRPLAAGAQVAADALGAAALIQGSLAARTIVL